MNLNKVNNPKDKKPILARHRGLKLRIRNQIAADRNNAKKFIWLRWSKRKLFI